MLMARPRQGCDFEQLVADNARQDHDWGTCGTDES
jgi:hypothetical protein